MLSPPSRKSLLSSFDLFDVRNETSASNRGQPTNLAASRTGEAGEAKDRLRLNQAILAGQEAALAVKTTPSYWDLTPTLGSHYVSQYSLMLKWLGKTDSALDVERLKRTLYAQQEPRLGGGWQAVKDKNRNEGDIDPTIFNYWALKAMGEDPGSPEMTRARHFILKHGGLEKASVFTKIFLALTGNMSWDAVPNIPKLLFKSWSPVNEEDFGQWIGPHLLPIAYLRSRELVRTVDDTFDVGELYRDFSQRPSRTELAKEQDPELSGSEEKLVDLLLTRQQPMGSWGGYTLSTLLSEMMLDDYGKQRPEKAASLTDIKKRGFEFIEDLYLNRRESSYQGATCDGRLWDTALIGLGLAESGMPLDRLRPVARWLASNQRATQGGFPFGQDFWYASDTDDTAEIIMFLNRFPEMRPNVEAGLGWLDEMQNGDGGWGAFAKDNEGGFFLEWATRPMKDSADFFDESSADVTGHILEAMGTLGRTAKSSKQVKDAVDYLKKEQKKSGFGAWSGRWGVNYIYGTGAAIVGLVRAGESPYQPYLQKALAWLASKQNEDGGFGETADSYRNKQLAGVGESTPSQTAWALLALMEGGPMYAKQAERAADYLMRVIERDGRWKDPSIVGTGHPEIVYMDYPSYAYAFPLTALARYRARMNDAP